MEEQMPENTTEIISSGELARRCGISVSMVRKLEKLGLLEPATRVVGLDRRFFRGDDVSVVRELVDKRRASQSAGRIAA